MIPYTRPYLPARERLDKYIDGIYERQWLTNNGQLVQELTARLETYLGVENLLLVSNGTLALQIAYRALGISERAHYERVEAITTPFTFVATASSLKWEGVEPVFVDIDSATWCLDPANIESAITPATRAIVPTHVFGNACYIEKINEIALRNNLKVVYDGAHSFGVTYKGDSILKYGDAATLSFHATKLFHSIEGGAIVFKERKHYEAARKMINFGITGPENIDCLGINAKMNEFQAAMGLSVLDELEENLGLRSKVWSNYESKLADKLVTQKKNVNCSNNCSYFPILLSDSHELELVQTSLQSKAIFARRYFYPSINKSIFMDVENDCEVSENIASRILCLPLYSDLDHFSQRSIIDCVLSQIDRKIEAKV
ncbi:DegT/DnrJ/EryC1/StrS family aminotransferase [Salinicola salarius]|uniref:DegT/DnrJ/EryC1/StrS family aminotransferase n=1 Tax=Salinicola salarius TaxID=430457 RepID=UPI000DA1D4DD|nr:DegT/DnrJ/EryC1/StrS family aminotransferase [Salinicola salarius]